MNKSNVWSLAAVGNAEGLRSAIVAMPTCINVAGWSYVAGRRRGIARRDGKFVIASEDAFPATVLHYAACRGDKRCVLVALSAGAQTSTGSIGDVTADVVAEQNGFSELAELLRVERQRNFSKSDSVEVDERSTRCCLIAEEEVARRSIEEPFANGIVTVRLILRESVGTIRKEISVPRFISFKTFRSKVESVMGQRVLLSYQSGHQEQDSHGAVGLQLRTAKQRHVELHSKTIGAFLQRERPVCTVRAMVPCATPSNLLEEAVAARFAQMDAADASRGDPPASSPKPAIGRSTPHNNTLVARQAELQRLMDDMASVPVGPDRTSRLRRILDDAERATGLMTRPNRRGIDSESLDVALRRLYQQPLSHILERRSADEELARQAQRKLFGIHGRLRSLSPHQQEAVEKLFRGDSEHRAESIQRLEVGIIERLPRPKPCELDPEESEAARRRLLSTNTRQQSPSTIREDSVEESSKVSHADLERHLQSVYYGAVSKRKDAVQKVEASLPKFQRDCAKKLTAAQVESLGQRLASRH